LVAASLSRVCQNRHGISQALGYLYESGGYFGKAFVAAPLMAEYQIEKAEKKGVGVITFNEKGEIIFRESKETLSERQSEIAEEVKNRVYLARECLNFLRQKLHF
jgi:hypothetical protein